MSRSFTGPSKLSPKKHELVEALLREEGVPASPNEEIPHRGAGGGTPLSFAQQRLWFLDQLEPYSGLYNIPIALRLSGPLDVAALRKTLDAIVARHEILRTTFAAVDGVPAQIIGGERPVELRVTDVSRVPTPEVEKLLREESSRPFDLSSDTPLRAALLKLGAEEHILLLGLHHIASDGWSMGVLYRELSVLYEAFYRGEVPSLPELPIQYVDYAVWQRQWLQGEVLEKQLSYWKQQLSGVAVLDLPTDGPRPAAQTFRGARKSAVFPKALCDELKALSRREGATLFMTLLAAFQTLLHRYTEQDDIVIGSPIAGRNRAEVEELIGLFINTLVFRGDLSGDPSFRELLARARNTALDAYEHQDLPFEKLVEELNPNRDLSRSPLFQVMFAFQTMPGNLLALPGLGVSPVELGGETAKFDLTLSVREAAGALTATVEYSTDLFEPATVRRMLERFQILLEGVVANPEQRLSRLPILTEAERREILVDWNDTARDYPKDQCVQEFFERQVERAPDAVAVSFDKKQLTYRELNRRANQLAHYLRKLGVEPETRVAVYMERSLEMVVGLLGILKAGATYVPLDVDYPNERVSFMLGDSQTKFLLTQKQFSDKLPEWRGKIVCLDPDWKTFSREPDDNPASGTTAENLAYVIYTSGSTGTPKGVAIPHRAIARLVINSDYVSVTPDDVVAQASNCSFDAATFEIWGALLNGARLVGVKSDVVLSPKEFAAQIDQQQISILFLTTALFNEMARQVPAAFKNMRHLLFGGEAVDPHWVREVLQHGPPERLLHVYGPTETTTFASAHLVKSAGAGATIPIGRPIANTEIYLLDRHLNPVPIGVPGEIYIGGDGLARCYLNNPELTAEKFIPHPFGDDPKARLYKTGDLARHLPDGAIEFLGRVDNQVKIRGFRIEPGEIEAVLGQHPGVRQAVVIAQEEVFIRKFKIENLKSGKRLVAYVASAQNPAPSSRELRNFLKQKLPHYMIPSAFIFLESFPLTPNGKVDRRALPDPGQSTLDHRNYVAPSGLIEQELARIWEDLLSVRPIGVDDDFFDLGGHSLLAVQMVHRIAQACGQRLPLTSLLAGPTIKHLAEALRIQRVEENRSLLVKVQPGGSKTPIFFLHGDFRRGGFYCLTLARCLGPDQPFYALAPHGLNGSAVPDSVEAMAASYIQMVREVQPQGPYLLGGFCNGGTVALEMAQQLRREGEDVSLVVLVAAGARNALAKRFARRFTDGLGSLVGFGPEKKLRLFLALRACVRPVRRLVRRARGLYRKHRSPTGDLFLRALSTYIARPYSGRVALFWPNESGSSAEASRDWHQAVPHIEVQTVPGNHVTCVAVHAEVLGDRMKTCLETAQEKVNSRSPDAGRSDLF
jgi:amino acid adenylation domain-containing protein